MTGTSPGASRTEEIKEEGGHLVDEAMAKGADIAHEAKNEGRHVVEEAKERVREQADDGAHRTAGAVRDIAGQLGSMAETSGEPGMLVDLTRSSADQLQRFADRLDQGGISGVVDDVKSFARRSPGVFLAASFGVGMVIGRLVRVGDTRALKDALTDRSTDSAPESGATSPEVPGFENAGTMERVGASAPGHGLERTAGT